MKLKRLLSITIVVILAGIYVQTNVYKKASNDNYKNSIEVLSDLNKEKEIGETKAIKLVKQYLEKNNSYVASNIEVDSIDNKYYTVHVYDVITNNDESHTATTGWYQVNKYTGEIIDIMQ